MPTGYPSRRGVRNHRPFGIWLSGCRGGYRRRRSAQSWACAGCPGGEAALRTGMKCVASPPVELLFQAAGRIEQVAPELCGPARRWRSLTPSLPVRHRKRESLEDYLTADVRTELGYRDLPPASVTPADPEPRLPDRWARDFRRYRMTENMSRSRPGLGLRLEFGEPVARPVLLGRLSHFGYGVFIPDEGQ